MVGRAFEVIRLKAVISQILISSKKQKKKQGNIEGRFGVSEGS